MKVILPCAGEQARWDGYFDIPKHLIPINDEPVLHRAVRITRETVPDAEIVIVVAKDDDRYTVPGAETVVVKTTKTNGDIDKITSSSHLWDETDRTAIIYGDVWWHHDTLVGLLTADVDDWRTWMRLAGQGGELFGFVIDATFNDRARHACAAVIGLHHAGRLAHAGYRGQAARGGWALYRVLTGAPVDSHGDHGHATLVNDGWTEDMDTPKDFDKWCMKWASTPPHKRPAR